MSQFQDQPSTDHHLQEQEQEQEAQGNIHDPELIQEKGGDNHVDDPVPSQEPGRPSLGELSAVDEENEGFRTPTSMEHKIPAITECPPAPRKPTVTLAIPMKRRIPEDSNLKSLRCWFLLKFLLVCFQGSWNLPGTKESESSWSSILYPEWWGFKPWSR